MISIAAYNSSQRILLFVERLGGFLVDRFCVLVVWLISTWIARLAGVDLREFVVWAPGSLRDGIPFVLELAIIFAYGLPYLAYVVILAMYIVYTVAANGRTPGMGAARVYLVTQEDGVRPGVLRVLVRHVISHLSGMFFGIGYLWALVDTQGRTWHDIVSGTRIVREIQC